MIKNSLHSISPDTTKLFGIYRGVVENNHSDIDKSGRIKVRVFGIHTAEKNETETSGISTDNLPWSEPVLSLFEGSVSGNGAWTVPLQGSHVFVFFENGNPMQPRYFASAPGIPSEAADGTKGFNDPDEVYPEILDEPDINKLSREVTEDTAIESINNQIDGSVTVANGGSWSEPQSSYNAEYPHNIVLKTHGDLLIEIDSTPDNRRFHIYHPSNSYIEINEDGQMIVRNKSDKYEIVDESKYQHVMGSKYITIGGSRYKHVEEDEEVNIGINQNENIGGSVLKNVSEDETINIGGNFYRGVGLSHTLVIGTTSNVIAGGTLNMDSPFVNINCGGYFGDDGTGSTDLARLGLTFGTGLETTTSGGGNNSDHFPDGYNMAADYLCCNDVGVILYPYEIE